MASVAIVAATTTIVSTHAVARLERAGFFPAAAASRKALRETMMQSVFTS